MAIYLDFETYSGTPITAGSVKYCHDPEADIVCLAYKVNDEPTQVWLPGQEIPREFYDVHMLYAHNAVFDYLVWHIIGGKYGFPITSLSQWRDTMALANRYSLPAKLASVGQILGLDIQKDKRGTALIKKICVPDMSGCRPVVYDQDMRDFIDYCKQDVDATYSLVNALPANRLAEDEQKYWELTQRMNLQGLPVDIDTVNRILDYIEGFSEELTKRVPEITDGRVNKVTQVAKLKDWITSRGLDVGNLQAATVEKLLVQSIPEDVREILELRQTLGRSSTAKYRKIKEMEYHGRVFNNLQYYGTSTGRWAGRGFQLHNLPRASVDNPEEYIDRFANFEPIEDPVNVAKALIRPMIRAQEGVSLIVSDYSSIENRLLAWVAQDEKALELFRTGADQYVDMASFMYQKDGASITKAERQIGKIIILGCGYGMGAKRFVETAASWGVTLSQSEALAAVNAYRDRYSLVKSLWYKLKDICVDAIQNPGTGYVYKGVGFRVVKCRAGNRWLVLTLPSRRNLYYMDPYLDDDKYGTVPGHMGINPYSKKWTRRKLIPGRITENVIQALARDLMANGLIAVDRFMPEITLLGSVHDEAIGEVRNEWINSRLLSRFNRHLCSMPDWAKGLPLAASGWVGKRYKK